MIRAVSLVKKFGSATAVNEVSFEVAAGENLVLLGTSGCGKTTTLRMINRLLEPDAGTVYIDGTDIRSLRPELLRRNIGYVLQHHGLFPHYTVAENIAIVPRLLKWDQRAIQQRAAEILPQLNLDPALGSKYPAELSGGQQQRAGLARALMVDPPVLLMDEPFGALDNITRANIRKEFRSIPELVSKTIVMVTHDVQEAFEMGDRICLMNAGEIQQTGTPKELLFQPANAFVSDFLKAQRLELEFRAVRLNELFPEEQVQPQLTVWDQLESLLLHEGTPGKGGADTLIRAFAAYKNR